MSVHSDDEFQGLSNSESSETANGGQPQTINDSLAALLESNRLLQHAFLSGHDSQRKRKVYVPMPEKFDGKIGDFIEAWLEQFET